MKTKCWHIWGAIVTTGLGILLHYIYDWSGGAFAAALFSAVNESTWEHLKLLAFPFLLFAALEYFCYGKELSNFTPAKFLGVLAGMFTITAAFYTYTGILGNHFLIADIATFLIGVVTAYLVSYRTLSSGRFSSRAARCLSGLGIAALVLLFFLFTFRPPAIGLFLDPANGA